MKRLEPNPDFVVWTGDNGPHVDDPSPNYPYITNVTSFVFSELKRMFGDIPVIPALGNHDSYPADSYNQDSDQYNLYYDQGGFKDHVGGGASKDTFLKCGYYTKTINVMENALKFIVLNTNLYYNNIVNFTDSDPCDQISWLNQTLTDTLENEKVYIVAHVPPGVYERTPNINFFNTPKDGIGEQIEKRYVSLVVQPGVHEKIQAHIYGHVHTDSFRLFVSRSGDDDVRGVGYLGSSGTPLLYDHNKPIGVNPGLRLFYLNDGGGLQDYSQFGLDLEKFNLADQDKKSRRKDLDNPTILDTDLINPTTPGPDSIALVTQKREKRDSPRKKRTLNRRRRDSPAFLDGLPPSDTENEGMVGPLSDILLSKSPQQFEQAASLLQDSTKASLVEPTTSKNLLGYPGENPKTSNNTTSDAKSKKLGYNGENPTPGDVTPSKNTTSEAKSKKLGFNGENPTPRDVVLSKNTTSDAKSKKPGYIGENPTPEDVTSSKNTTSDAKSRLPGDLGENSTTDAKQINITTSTPDANNAIAEAGNATIDGNTATADADAALVDAMSAEFILLYNATDAFNIKDLSASEMAKGYQNMLENRSMFNQYYLHNTVDHLIGDGVCDEVCFRGHMCSIKFQVFEDVKTCLNSTSESILNIGFSIPSLEPVSTTPSTTTASSAPDSSPPYAFIASTTSSTTSTSSTTTSTATSEDTTIYEEASDKFLDNGDVLSEPVDPGFGRVSSKVAGVFLGVSGSIILLLILGFAYRKYRNNRQRDQEFLLTDSVFRYDGYSQLDDDF
ncbi:uncharacterized protein LOC111698017 isoform X2 [Eurytemora carolleeae]|uniref:uncharacterized protein LOC111698017 isoform X2 n=1 Tax=Eurytemora carolleeae TaxID=1294199 RepID=UPI000C770AA1|nr:uncharacterized protein LOC111698017 isoform X2 [Eurytemora carolleeae]|eukprot:XP_023324002.1 uncharacterized protein LOC111698017 isoform X2 [Eurytemora affinis]